MPSSLPDSHGLVQVSPCRNPIPLRTSTFTHFELNQHTYMCLSKSLRIASTLRKVEDVKYLPAETLLLDVTVAGIQQVYVDADDALKSLTPPTLGRLFRARIGKAFEIAQGHVLRETTIFIAVPANEVCSGTLRSSETRGIHEAIFHVHALGRSPYTSLRCIRTWRQPCFLI